MGTLQHEQDCRVTREFGECDCYPGEIERLKEENAGLRTVLACAQDWLQDTEEEGGIHPEWKALSAAISEAPCRHGDLLTQCKKCEGW